MKTLGESLVSFAIHATKCQIDSGGLFGNTTTMVSGELDSKIRGEILLDALTTLDASARDGEIGFASPYLTWMHTPVEGDAYRVTVRIG